MTIFLTSCQTAGTAPADTNRLYEKKCISRDLGKHVLAFGPEGRLLLEWMALMNRTFRKKCP